MAPDPPKEAKATLPPNFKPPEPNEKKPGLWFRQLEILLNLHGIIDESTRYDYASAFLPPVFSVEAEDIVNNKPTSNPYQTLKNRVIECFTASEMANYTRVLEHEELGDRTPSQFLRHLKSLVPDIDEKVLKIKWLARLPKPIQLGIANQEAELDKLAKAADVLFELLPSTSHVAATSNMEQQLAQLTKELASIKADLRSRSRSSSRSRSCSCGRQQQQKKKQRPVRLKDGVCRFHVKYGAKAFRCAPGCKFQGNRHESR